MKLTQPVKILIGLALLATVVLPLCLIAIWFGMAFSPLIAASQAGSEPPPGFILLFLIGVPLFVGGTLLANLLYFGLEAFFLAHIILNTRPPNWARVLFGLGNRFMLWLSAPVYYFMYIWSDDTTPSATTTPPPPATILPDDAPVSMSSPDLGEAERQAVGRVLRTPNLSMGPEIAAFEADFAAYSGARHAIGVSSGTAGLHLCIRAAGIERGDLVLTTPFSFVASANVALFEGAVPVFVDVDPLTGNMDAALAAQAAADLAAGGSAAKRWLPRRGASAKAPLKALLPVDVFGQPADMDAFGEIARRHGLVLIEDACEALGAEYKGRKAGVLGDMGVYAFYPNKQITTGEGAVIVTDDDQRAGLMRALRNQGRAPGDTWLQHTHLGYNYRLDEMSAALGRAQLGRLEELLQHRTQVADWYAAELTGLPGVELPQLSANTTRVAWFVYVVRFAPQIDRDRVAQELGQRGIPARPYFLPIHLQPYMVERFGYRPGDFPVTEDLGRRGLALPFSGVMPQAHVRRVAAALGEALPLAQR